MKQNSIKIFDLNISLLTFDELVENLSKDSSEMIAPITIHDLIKSFFYIKRKKYYSKIDYFYIDSYWLYFMLSLFFSYLNFESSSKILLNILQKHKDNKVMLLGVDKNKKNKFLLNIKRFFPYFNFMGIIDKNMAILFIKQSKELINKIDPDVIVMNIDIKHKENYIDFFKKNTTKKVSYIFLNKGIKIFLNNVSGHRNKKKTALSFFYNLFFFAFKFLFFPVYLIVLLVFITSIMRNRK